MRKVTDPDALLLQGAADATRLSILRQLSGGEAVCACDFVACCDVAQPTISHHLKVLHDSGLLDREKRGVWVYYRVNPQALSDLGALIGGVAG